TLVFGRVELSCGPAHCAQPQGAGVNWGPQLHELPGFALDGGEQGRAMAGAPCRGSPTLNGPATRCWSRQISKIADLSVARKTVLVLEQRRGVSRALGLYL